LLDVSFPSAAFLVVWYFVISPKLFHIFISILSCLIEHYNIMRQQSLKVLWKTVGSC